MKQFALACFVAAFASVSLQFSKADDEAAPKPVVYGGIVPKAIYGASTNPVTPANPVPATYVSGQGQAFHINQNPTADADFEKAQQEFMNLVYKWSRQMTTQELKEHSKHVREELEQHEQEQNKRLSEIENSLKELIESHPRSTAAESARRALKAIKGGHSTPATQLDKEFRLVRPVQYGVRGTATGKQVE